jgi:hypothetical protein
LIIAAVVKFCNRRFQVRLSEKFFGYKMFKHAKQQTKATIAALPMRDRQAFLQHQSGGQLPKF